MCEVRQVGGSAGTGREASEPVISDWLLALNRDLLDPGVRAETYPHAQDAVCEFRADLLVESAGRKREAPDECANPAPRL